MLPMAFKPLEFQTPKMWTNKNLTKFLGRISMLSLKRRPFFFFLGGGIRGFFESLPWNGQETPPELGEFALIWEFSKLTHDQGKMAELVG